MIQINAMRLAKLMRALAVIPCRTITTRCPVVANETCSSGVKHGSRSVSEAGTVFRDLALHEHCCYLYGDPEEYLTTLCGFLRAGLSRGERCLYVGHHRAARAIRQALEAVRINVEQAQAIGALGFETTRDVYLPTGTFDAERTLAMWRDAVRQAQADGFAGLRILSEASGRLRCGPCRKEWLRYEQGLTESLQEIEAAALCICRHTSMPQAATLDALRSHPVGLMAGIFGQSLHHIPGRRSPSPSDARYPGHPVARDSATAISSGAEERISRVLAMSALVAAIAHEIRQPLAAVAANANAGLRWLRAREPRLAPARRSFSCIVRDIRRAGDIIVRVRSLVKRGTETERRLVDPGAVIRKSISLVQADLRRSRAALRLELPRDLPRVLGDTLQLQQVMLNLLRNALEAMASVHGRRELRILAAPGAADSLVITVRDTGVGFGPRGATRAFEPFYSTKAHGMGVGLWICRMLIEAHGGRLWVAPTKGPGATVHFSLPCGRPTHE